MHFRQNVFSFAFCLNRSVLIPSPTSKDKGLLEEVHKLRSLNDKAGTVYRSLVGHSRSMEISSSEQLINWTEKQRVAVTIDDDQ